MTTTNPSEWQIPTWHPDWGNPAIEVGMLREFCVKAIEQFPNLSMELSTFEEGYLNVDVSRDGQKVAEIYIVSGNENRSFAIFGFDGEKEADEQYFSEYAQGLMMLEEMLK